MTPPKLIREKPTHDTLGIANALLVAPGEVERSVLYLRMIRRGEHQMPPTSTNQVDKRGAALIAEWIRGLDSTSAP